MAKVTNGNVSKYLRISKTLEDRIQKLADADNRSWSSMAAVILEHGAMLLELGKKKTRT